MNIRGYIILIHWISIFEEYYNFEIFSKIFEIFIKILKILFKDLLFSDHVTPYQIGFQFPASPLMMGIIDLHNHILFFLYFILYIVNYFLFKTLVISTIKNVYGKSSVFFSVKKLYNINIKHSTILELIWICIPTLILIFIVIHSFALLYSSEINLASNITLKVIGHQWYWSYELYIEPNLDLQVYRYNSVPSYYRLLNNDNKNTFHYFSYIFEKINRYQLYFKNLSNMLLMLLLSGDEDGEPIINTKDGQYYTFDYSVLCPKFDDYLDERYNMLKKINPTKDWKTFIYVWFFETFSENEYIELDNDVSISKKGHTLIFDSFALPETDILDTDLRWLTTTNPVCLPYKTNVKVLITSDDVLHSWAVPALGIKMDACPGRLNQVNLYMNRIGHFFGQCSELCGVNHGFMPIEIYSVSKNNFLSWLYLVSEADALIFEELLGYYWCLSPGGSVKNWDLKDVGYFGQLFYNLYSTSLFIDFIKVDEKNINTKNLFTLFMKNYRLEDDDDYEKTILNAADDIPDDMKKEFRKQFAAWIREKYPLEEDEYEKKK